MTQEWIDQFNKKCAEFLGWKFEEDDLIFSFDKKNSFEFLNRPAYAIYDLKFHSDWNWIMEVVEKIESIKDLFPWITIKSFNIRSDDKPYNEIKIRVPNRKSDGDNLFHYEGEFNLSKKEAVIKAIDQFIDWYNKQKES